jgi:hypothetical protein
LKAVVYIIIAVFFSLKAFSQTDSLRLYNNKAENKLAAQPVIDSSKQKDVGDLILNIFTKKKSSDKKSTDKKLNISVIPSAGYTLTTGFAADLTGNGAFYTTSNHHENLSVVDGDLSYDTKTQKIFVSRSEIWSDKNNYKFTSDIRWMQFPENTYGIGTTTTPADADPLVFDYLKVYTTLYKRIIPASDYYIGFGYNLDYHYNITEAGNKNKTITDFQSYGGQLKTTSSGVNINFLFDSRSSTINALYGTYANITYTQNLKSLGSNSDWEQLQIDFRKYFKLSQYSNNVLAVWGYVWLTKGNTPYLDLPYTGGDTFNNTGRGYIQGRFTGRNMLYAETEYRFGILKSGLLGGVLFANAESLTEYQSNSFEKIAPAAGTGIRIKVNKHSNTNVCIDYGFGIDGSRGFFVNLAEVF